MAAAFSRARWRSYCAFPAASKAPFRDRLNVALLRRSGDDGAAGLAGRDGLPEQARGLGEPGAGPLDLRRDRREAARVAGALEHGRARRVDLGRAPHDGVGDHAAAGDVRVEPLGVGADLLAPGRLGRRDRLGGRRGRRGRVEVDLLRGRRTAGPGARRPCRWPRPARRTRPRRPPRPRRPSPGSCARCSWLLLRGSCDHARKRAERGPRESPWTRLGACPGVFGVVGGQEPPLLVALREAEEDEGRARAAPRRPRPCRPSRLPAGTTPWPRLVIWSAYCGFCAARSSALA